MMMMMMMMMEIHKQVTTYILPCQSRIEFKCNNRLNSLSPWLAKKKKKKHAGGWFLQSGDAWDERDGTPATDEASPAPIERNLRPNPKPKVCRELAQYLPIGFGYVDDKLGCRPKSQ